MKIKYNNATIHIRGVVNKRKIEDATITFIVKAQRSKKDQRKIDIGLVSIDIMS